MAPENPKKSLDLEGRGLLKAGMKLWTTIKEFQNQYAKQPTEPLSHTTANQVVYPPPYGNVHFYSLEKLDWKASGLGISGNGMGRGKTQDLKQIGYVKDCN